AGDYHKTAPIETFTASNHDRHPTDLAGLRGARLVTAVETEEGRRWAESRIKALTGGDKIAARFMRQDFFEYLPQFKLIIAGNHKPGLRGKNRNSFKPPLRETMEDTAPGMCAPMAVNVTVRRPTRPREYLTEREIERLIKAAGENRWGHRDATA